jgi:hypothetical protein
VGTFGDYKTLGFEGNVHTLMMYCLSINNRESILFSERRGCFKKSKIVSKMIFD